MPEAFWPVVLHDGFWISTVICREVLTITLSVEATADNAGIVPFYSCTCDKVKHTGRYNSIID